MILVEKKVHMRKILSIILAFVLGVSLFEFVPAEAADIMLPFNDVSQTDWCYTPLQWCYDNGILKGVSSDEFAPDVSMTRGMMVTVLWRYAGSNTERVPAAAGGGKFSDVFDDEYYYQAVNWASANGIVNGIGDGLFAPNDTITREQMYTILYRYMNFDKINLYNFNISTFDGTTVQFIDEDKIDDWAKPAMHLMYDTGVMIIGSDLYVPNVSDNGAINAWKPSDYSRPQDDALRWEIAVAMYFFDKLAVPIPQHI